MDMSSHCEDTSRHSLDMHKHPDMSRELLTLSRHYPNTSTHCLDTFMTALENGLERKKMIHISYNDLCYLAKLHGILCDCNWYSLDPEL